jgi:(S)-ureidoglycine aminohydrolase
MDSHGARGRAYTLITPANHYPSQLPYLDGTIVKLVTPRLAPARLGMALIALAPGGRLAVDDAPGIESFLYGLDGDASVRGAGWDAPLGGGAYAYVPAGGTFTVRAGGDAPARLLWCKRRYEPAPGLPAPEPSWGHRDDEPFAATPHAGFRRRELIAPADPRHDLNMSLLAFDAGVGLPYVEIHDEEHGLYMTAGGGDYLLDAERHAVEAGDFIYMAPYCPQAFTAGAAGGEYLLYKDVWRDGF